MYCSDNGITVRNYHKYPDLGFQTRYDCYFRLPNSVYIGCELKVNRLKKTFNFKQLFGYGRQYHEIKNLLQDIELGDTGWCIIAHRGNSNQFRAFAITPIVADFYYNSGSVGIEELEENSIELPRKHRDNELLFDLTPIL